MMNKAEKRIHEMQTVATIYTITLNQIESEKYDLKWRRESKADLLKDSPEADTDYLDIEIEMRVIAIEKLEKIAELLLKQM